MAENPLLTIMAPRSIAVAGVSSSPIKMGSILFLNLLHGGFKGELFPVHPERRILFGKKAYATPKMLPYPPDLALIATPANTVPDLLEDFGKIGTRHVIIVTGGFKETGKNGRQMEYRVLESARNHGIRIMGPNCLGVINANLSFNTTPVPFQDKPGYFSLASQSGTYVAQALSYLKKRGIRLAKAISVGNEADIDLVDCLEYLEQDEETRAIGLYIESIRRVECFLEMASQITIHKPIIAQFVGGTKAGAAACASHTGAMTGPDYIYKGLFAQAGIIPVKTIEEVFAFGNALAMCPVPKGNRIAILTNSGGPGSAMASTLDAEGMEVPAFSQPVRDKLNQFLPNYASSRNPVDLTFHMGMELLADKLPEILLSSEEIDGLLVHGIMDTGFIKMLIPLFDEVFDGPPDRIEKRFTADLTKFIKMPGKFKKPVIASSFLGREDHAICEFHENAVPVFNSPEMAARAMAVCYQYHQIRNRSLDPDLTKKWKTPEAAYEIIENASADGLDEYTAKKILRAYGIATCCEKMVRSEADAVSAAVEIGFPVAVKGCSPGLFHKTEKQMVYLNLTDDILVRRACRSIREKLKESAFLVSEMIIFPREFMAGMTRFSDFPPSILFGLGGIFAEALSDFDTRFAPLGENEALRFIWRIRSKKLLEEFRGESPVDLKALSSILIGLGRIALDFPQIKEIDLNPILIDKGIPKVADALFIF